MPFLLLVGCLTGARIPASYFDADQDMWLAWVGIIGFVLYYVGVGMSRLARRRRSRGESQGADPAHG